MLIWFICGIFPGLYAFFWWTKDIKFRDITWGDVSIGILAWCSGIVGVAMVIGIVVFSYLNYISEIKVFKE